MITKRSANERGHMKWSWLEAFHSFSFASYFDPKWMGFHKLRVINDDFIDGGRGFDTHPHRNMEIVSFIIDGGLEHKDTMGNHYTINPGEIQVMSAGTGIEHSEYNPYPDKKTHSLQIWIEPNIEDITPSYQSYKYTEKINELTLLASGHDKSVAKIHQDADIYVGKYENYQGALSISKNHAYWLHCYKGSGQLNSEHFKEGDGFAIESEGKMNLEVTSVLEFLLFKLG